MFKVEPNPACAEGNHRYWNNCKTCGKVLNDNESGFTIKYDDGLGYPNYLTCSIECANMWMLAHAEESEEPKINKLKARWTVDVASQLKAVHGLDIEQEFKDAFDKITGDIV